MYTYHHLQILVISIYLKIFESAAIKSSLLFYQSIGLNQNLKSLSW